MAQRIIKIWYIKEADLLEVAWDDKVSYFIETDHDRIFAEVDLESNVEGVQITGVTRIEDGVLKIQVPRPEEAEEKAQKPQKVGPHLLEIRYPGVFLTSKMVYTPHQGSTMKHNAQSANQPGG
jgi:hypothetical protein